jgi:hypothetical protein
MSPLFSFIISVFAIIIAALKDFILPLFLKPKLVFGYTDQPPFRRSNVSINGDTSLKGTFLRFSIKNEGRRPALNCRCQVLQVKQEGRVYGDYQGFPLKWASRPESVLNQASGERLNIARGETEFVDVAYTTNKDSFIHLQKYHSIGIGIREVIENGEYTLFLLFSGDNFKPWYLKFRIERGNSNNPDDVKLTLIQSSQKPL